MLLIGMNSNWAICLLKVTQNRKKVFTMETYYEIKRIYRSKIAYFLIILVSLLVILPFFELSSSSTNVIKAQYALQLNSQKSTYDMLKQGNSKAEKEAAKKAKISYDLVSKITDNVNSNKLSLAEKNVYLFEKNNLLEMEDKSIVSGNIFGQQMMVDEYGYNLKHFGKINFPAQDLTATAYISYLLTNLLPNQIIYVAFALITFNLFVPASGVLGKRLILNRNSSKMSYLLSKYLASVGMFIALILVITVIIFMIIGVKNGFGSTNTITTFTLDFDKVIYYNFWDIVIRFFGITILNLSVMFIIGMLFQQFANNNLIQVILEMLPFLLISQKNIVGDLQTLLPTASFDVSKSAFGYSWMETLSNTQNIPLSSTKPFILSLIWIVIGILIYFIFNNPTKNKQII